MVKNIFRLSMLAIFATALLVIITPVLTVNNLLYPIRIDSSFVSQRQIEYEKALAKGAADSGRVFLYNPGQLKLGYSNLELILPDSESVRGWLVVDSTRSRFPLLLIVPDIEEGAIDYIPVLREFFDRGFNVCVMNMRGQGESGGDYYDMTARAASDLTFIAGELKKFSFVDKISVLGVRTGAAITIKAFNDAPNFADVMILQNPIRNLEHFFREQEVKKWGQFILPILPALKRSYEQKTGISIEDYNYSVMVSKLFSPQMVVVANHSSKKAIEETVQVYHASNFYRKRFYIDDSSYEKPAGFGNSKQYFDKISAFINSSLPGKPKKSRFRKLAQR